MKNKRTLVLINAAIAILAPYAWLKMVFGSSDGVLVSAGLRSLRYFTILSNLLAAAAAIIYLLNLNRITRNIKVLKYVAAVSVGLTFLVVLVFLGPLFGYVFMFTGVSFWLHLIVPVLAMTEFILSNDVEMKRRDNMIAVIPMFLYGIFYLGNILINGIGEWPDSNDWYAFMSWGYPIGFAIFFIIIFVTYLIGLTLRKTNAKMR